MKATEARQLTDANLHELIPPELSDLIRKAAIKGESSVRVEARTYGKHKSALELLGHDCWFEEFDDEDCAIYLVIEW